MTQQYLIDLSPGDEAIPTYVRPNVWLLASDELPPLLLNPEQAARLLGMGRHRIFDLIRDGALRSVKVGNSRRISARALAEFVAGLERQEQS